jgi:hypothetical protein
VRGVGAVDLVGQNDVGEDGARLEVELLRVLVEDRHAEHVAGSRSGVSCTRLNLQLMLRASDLASTVLPTPGTSSISTWPRRQQPDQEEVHRLAVTEENRPDVVPQPVNLLVRHTPPGGVRQCCRAALPSCIRPRAGRVAEHFSPAQGNVHRTVPADSINCEVNQSRAKSELSCGPKNPSRKRALSAP